MRLLVLGANGLLGSNLITSAQSRGWTVVGTYHTDLPAFDIELLPLDIRDVDRFELIIERVNPEAIVNTAAMTDVDECESNPEQALEINGRAPGRLAGVCSFHDIEFCHISTDYVFGGEQNHPYTEEAEPAPMQTYGKSKLAGERAVSDALPNSLITRLSFVYGIHGATGELAGFPAWVRDKLNQGSEISLFSDQFISPTSAGRAADDLLDLLDADLSGIYHVASRSCATPYQFGMAVCSRITADEALIQSSSMAEVDRPAQRPRYSCLEVSKLEADLGRVQPNLETDLDDLFNRLEPG